jgi:hypothetical protein
MSEGRIVKPDKDFSKDVDTQIPEAEQLAKVILAIMATRCNTDC